MSRYDGHLKNVHYAWLYNTDASGSEAIDQASFLISTVILGFLSIFKKSQALSTFEALISACLLKCQGMCGPCPDEAGT